MTEPLAGTFERILRLAQELPVPSQEEERKVSWCDRNQIIGISRQPRGGYEIFLCGDELRPISTLVRRHLKFDDWTREGGESFRANRLVLPSEQHFLPVAAFLTEELLRWQATTALEQAFANTEPLIEMALRRIALGEEELLGLLGELRFLEVLLTVAGENPARRALALDMWRGHQQGSRDFVSGARSVEVKATRGQRSHHRISSVFQVDPRRDSAEVPQESLYLLSMGFDQDISDAKWTLTLPGVVERIVSLLAEADSVEGERSDLQILFLTKLRQYGALGGAGYDHDVMRNWSAYLGSWQHSFVRIYDMGDPTVQVLRRTDIQSRGHVVLASVSFEVDLPERVSGDLNPRSDLDLAARHLFHDSLS